MLICENRDIDSERDRHTGRSRSLNYHFRNLRNTNRVGHLKHWNSARLINGRCIIGTDLGLVCRSLIGVLCRAPKVFLTM